MTDQYIKDALRTEASPDDDYKISARIASRRTIRLLHAGMGIATEAGEFLDVLKKNIFYGTPIDDVNLIEELGDLFWYCAIAADALGVSFDEIKRRNIDKLVARYGNKFSDHAANNRDLYAERDMLQK